jgi:hypothetical protein
MSSRPLYPSSGSTEPSMRKELKNTLEGHYPEVAKGQKALLRKMRVDALGKHAPCPCVDKVTGEPDKDTFCPVCHGEGLLWDEAYIEVYKVVLKSDVGNVYREVVKAPGLNNASMAKFFCKSAVQVTRNDKIVEIVLDKEGKATQPLTRRSLYNVVAVIDYRADSGRLEYWKLDCYEEKRKFLNGGKL